MSGPVDQDDRCGASDPAAHPAAEIARIARRQQITVAAAESVTAGNISSALAAADGAAEWFRGSIVAYATPVKVALLGVDAGPVITARAAGQLACGAARVLGADIAVGSTGAGGPEPTEGRSPGTVFIAVATVSDCRVAEYHFDGDPAQVVATATEQALRDLADGCRRWFRAGPADGRGNSGGE